MYPTYTIKNVDGRFSVLKLIQPRIFKVIFIYRPLTKYALNK